MHLLPEDHENVKQFLVETRARRRAPLSNAEQPVLDLETEVAKVRDVGEDARHIGRAQRVYWLTLIVAAAVGSGGRPARP